MFKKFSAGSFIPILALFIYVILIGCSENLKSGEGNENVSAVEIITDRLVVPWQMDFTPDGRILITERIGFVRVVKDGKLMESPWIDLRDSITTTTGEIVKNSGVLGIAVDPDFQENGFVYIGYSYEAENKDYDYNKLVRYREDHQTGKVEFDKVLMDKVKGVSLHNSGQLKFGPDSKLYWSTGDRHVPESAQDLADKAGGILRINSDGSVPLDNPFSGSYIYAYGLRNSQGFDWHPERDVMLATEHGSVAHDEINIIEPGKNYGWPVIRGDEEKEGMIRPLLHSGVGEPVDDYTWAPSGATFVYTGPWEGSFLFGGLRSQSLWRLILDEQNEVVQLNRYLEKEYGRIRSVEQSSNGHIYLLTSNLDRENLPIGKDFLLKLDIHSLEK